MAAPYNIVTVGVEAANATLTTAVTNYNTAIATAITAALAVSGVNKNTVAASNMSVLWDSTNYVCYGTVSYSVNN
jgi:uncharacterized protein YggE